MKLVINDGQHRCAGIAKALENGSTIKNDTLSVLLFPWESTARVQQMFSDLNRFVQKTSKSLDILYDKRDEIGAATPSAIQKIPMFRDLTEKEKGVAGSEVHKAFYGSQRLHDANTELLKGYEDKDIEANASLLVEFWTEVAKHMPDWASVQSGRKLALELRQEKISSHSTVLRALGGLGAELKHLPNWKTRLEPPAEIDLVEKRIPNGTTYGSWPIRLSPTAFRGLGLRPRHSSNPSSSCP